MVLLSVHSTCLRCEIEKRIPLLRLDHSLPKPFHTNLHQYTDVILQHMQECEGCVVAWCVSFIQSGTDTGVYGTAHLFALCMCVFV